MCIMQTSSYSGQFMINNVDITLADIHAAVVSGEYSYEQLMRDTLNVISRYNPTINAIVALQEENDLIAQARLADQSPVKGVLHGIPIAIKDLVNVAGIVSTFGSPILKKNIPVEDDEVARRIRQAGAIIIGKTNTPEFGFGSQTYNPVYGTTATPYDVSKTSGGSSGGAAAALAARMLLVADGSDMMGSLRNPAAFCNVYGMRPTYGLVPVEPRGDVFMHQLATLGPMARTPIDLATLLDVMAGPDSRHPHSIPQQIRFAEEIQKPLLKPVKMAWLSDWGGNMPMEMGVLAVCESALKVFEDQGHHVEAIDAPFSHKKLWESWSQLRGFAIAALLKEPYQNEKTRELLKPEAIFEIEVGKALTVDKINKASLIRAEWFAKTTEMFTEFDVIVLPSCQVFPFDKTVHWPTHINQTPMSTYHRWMEVVVPTSLIGLPAVNVPAGFNETGLPMGMQLIGPRNSDINLLQLTQQYHLQTKWPQLRPPVL